MNMMYEISPEIRTLAIKLENERRKKQSEESGTPSKSSTEEQSSLRPPSGYREEIDYREGFRWPYNKYERPRQY